jgi:hypothetical protein
LFDLPLTPPITKEIEGLLKKRYSQATPSEEQKILDGLQNFISHIKLHRSSRNLLQEAAKTIHRVFPFQEVALGIRNPEDGLYRYDTFIGYSREAEAEFKKQVYDLKTFFDPGEFPSVRISKMIDLTLAENEPRMEKEQACWNRPTLLKVPRKSPDEFTEGDYMDVFAFSEDNELIAWIELSAPRDGKMPSSSTLKGLELFAAVLSLGLQSLAPKEKDIPAKR